MDSLHSSNNEEVSQDLIPALIKCFGIILIGYVFGRFQILPNHLKNGVGLFLQYLAFPGLLFKLVATISFDSVNWAFVASVFVAKTIIFFVVALISMFLIRPVHVGKAGLYAIAATQSNDFALGYPLLVSLYQHSHSNYSSFLYLTAPIQVLILNPVGFFMMEIYKQAQDHSNSKNAFISIMKGIFSNPIVAMTVIGLIWNFAFNHTIPQPLAQMVDAISDSFPATTLVLLGHSMVGKISTFTGHFVLTPVLLILAKVLVLPILLQKIVVMLTAGSSAQEIQDLSSLGFLYGTIPCAPAVFVFACQYDFSVDIISASVVFSTLCSAPIMFVSATMATLSLHGFEKATLYMEGTIGYISSISLISCLWLLIIFSMSKRWYSASYGATTYLVLAQLITSVGGILCFFRDRNTEGILYAQYMMSTGGILSTRIWTVFLAVLLFLSQWKSMHFILSARYVINIAGFVTSFGIAFLLAGSLLSNKKPTSGSSPDFQLGFPQILLTAVITVLCLLLTAVCLAMQHKFRKTVYSNMSTETSYSADETTKIKKTGYDQDYASTESQRNGEICHSKNSGTYNFYDNSLDDSENVNSHYTAEREASINYDYDTARYQISHEPHFAHNSDAEETGSSQDIVEQLRVQEADSEENQRILRHTMLLIILCLSMLITFFVCLWKLFLEATNGIFAELEFLDIALTYGQGIIYFLIFGLDTAVIMPCAKVVRHIQCWCASLPSRNVVSSEA